jgi:hypothetical protein
LTKVRTPWLREQRRGGFAAAKSVLLR